MKLGHGQRDQRPVAGELGAQEGRSSARHLKVNRRAPERRRNEGDHRTPTGEVPRGDAQCSEGARLGWEGEEADTPARQL